MITLEQFQAMLPTSRNAAMWYNLAVELFPKYGLNTSNRIAGFMSQAGHESNDFRVVQENLNYSESGLLKTFPRYFTKATAKRCARKPEMIANIVYDDANRTYKLGNVNPGDGWKFRGRGLIQITGRWNYEKFGLSIGKTPEETVDYAESTKGAMESALWYWNANNLNRFADSDDIIGLSRAVNGGDIGLSDRIDRYNTAKKIIGSVKEEVADVELKRGSRGDDVRSAQKALGVGADGIFGVTTEAAVRSWQRTNRYPVTGKLDTQQLSKLLG